MSYITKLRTAIGHDRILSVACGAIIENEHEEVLLQLRSDTHKYGTPGGNMELGETIMETLIREVKEEINLEIKPQDASIFAIYSGEKSLLIYPNHDEVQYVHFIFYIKIKGDLDFKMDEESLELKFFKREDIPQNLMPNDKIWIEKWKNFDFELKID